MFEQFTHGASFFEDSVEPGDRIFGAVDPRVVVIAAHHPFIGRSGTGNFCDDVVDGLDVPIRFHFEVHFRRAGADAVSHAESAAPIGGSDASGERGEKRLRVAVRNREHGNFCDRRRFFDLEALRVFRCADAGSERIAGVERHVGDAAALDSVFRTPRALRKCFALREAVFVGIGINQAADGAVFGGDFRLDAAPGMVITRDDDFSFDAHAHAIELFVIFGDAVVDVDERSGDVTVDGVDVVRGKLLVLLIRSWILREGRLLQLGAEFRAAFDEFDDAFFRRRIEHVELFDVRVEAELFKFGGDPFGVFLVARRADVVRVLGKVLHVGAEIVGAGDAAEFFFPLALGARGVGGVAEQGLVVGPRGDARCERGERERC